MLASGKFELVSCTCGNCDSHIVADSTELVAHCIVCGSALDSEDEGEDAVDVRIAPETEEDEQTFLASSADVGFLADLVDILAENGVTTNVELLEALISGDSTNVDADALKQLNDDVVELLGEEAFAEAESEGTIAETLVDTLLGDDEIGASVTTPNYAPPLKATTKISTTSQTKYQQTFNLLSLFTISKKMTILTLRFLVILTTKILKRTLKLIPKVKMNLMMPLWKI